MIDVYEVIGYPVSWPVETFTEGFYKSKESAEKAMNDDYVGMEVSTNLKLLLNIICIIKNPRTCLIMQ